MAKYWVSCGLTWNNCWFLISDGTLKQNLTVWVLGIWSPSMKTEDPIQLVFAFHWCHPRLLRQFTVLDLKIGVVIAILNAIGSLLDLAKWWVCSLRNLLLRLSIWIFILLTLPLSSTRWIKSRLDNRFYRRASAVEFDVNYIFTNARKFNQPDSDIVRSASNITDLCLEIIRNRDVVDVPVIYQQLSANYKLCDERTDASGANTSTRGSPSISNNISSWQQSDREKVSSKSSKSRNGVDTLKSKANYFKFYVIENVILMFWIISGNGEYCGGKCWLEGTV